MGKISDYHEQMERERKKTTVAEFAKELHKSVDALMGQLCEAGVKKTSETDPLTDADKQVLLRFLQKSHGINRRRKKITLNIESEVDRLLKAVVEQENGAEWACLEYFAGSVIAGSKIEPKLQEVVNLIIAKSLIFEALPIKKLGRPKLQESEDLGKEVAQEYWDLRDSGSSYSDAAGHLAEKVHKDERHVMRLVEKHKKSVGLTYEDREKNRQWRGGVFQIPLLSRDPVFLDSLYEMYKRPPSLEFTGNDYIEYLDEKIVKSVQLKPPTDIKEPVFIASD